MRKLVATLKSGRKSKSITLAIGSEKKLVEEPIRWKAAAAAWANMVAESNPDFKQGKLRIKMVKLEA